MCASIAVAVVGCVVPIRSQGDVFQGLRWDEQKCDRDFLGQANLELGNIRRAFYSVYVFLSFF